MRAEIPTVKDLKEDVLNTIRGCDWYPRLRLFLMGGEFDHILQEILNDYSLGYRITPQLKYMFRAFTECPFESTRVVLHTSWISPYLLRSDGLAFSQSIKGRADTTLKYIFEEIEKTINPKYKGSPDLTRWSRQGILLSTSSLTTVIGDTTSPHVKLWRPFWNYCFEAMQDLPEDTIFVLVGEDVWSRESGIKHGNIIKTVLPGANAPNAWGVDIFRRINEELKLKGGEIKW